MPKVSIIIPVYNTSVFLERCLNSVFEQTFSDYEAIIVNDGSTDSSEEICKDLIKGRERFQLYTKDNGGLSSARLYGLHKSTGDFIVFIDSDDYIEKTYLAELYKAITDTNADLCLCSYYIDNGKSKTCELIPEEYGLSIEGKEAVLNYIYNLLPTIQNNSLLLHSYMWMRMFKRNILQDKLFVHEENVFLEDLALNVLLSSYISRISFAHEPLYNYCVNEGSLTLRFREKLFPKFINLSNLIEKELLSYEEPAFVYSRMNDIRVIWIEYSLVNDTRSTYQYFRKEFIFIKDYVNRWKITWNKHRNVMSLFVHVCLVFRLSLLFFLLNKAKRLFRCFYYLILHK